MNSSPLRFQRICLGMKSISSSNELSSAYRLAESNKGERECLCR